MLLYIITPNSASQVKTRQYSLTLGLYFNSTCGMSKTGARRALHNVGDPTVCFNSNT